MSRSAKDGAACDAGEMSMAVAVALRATLKDSNSTVDRSGCNTTRRMVEKVSEGSLSIGSAGAFAFSETSGESLRCFFGEWGSWLEKGLAGLQPFLQGECGQELFSIFVSQFGFAAGMGLFEPC